MCYNVINNYERVIVWRWKKTL